VPDASNPCPHSHVKKLDVEGWIKRRWKCNVKVKVECVMRNEQIDGLTINHSLAPLPKQKQMRILDAEEMESSSKIDLRNVSWWMYIKETCRPRALVMTKLSKEKCISLIVGGKPFHVACRYDWNRCGPPQLEKHTPPKWAY